MSEQERIGQRIVDLVLEQALNHQARHLWLLPRPECVSVLTCSGGEWQEMIKPSPVISQELVAALKRLASLETGRRRAQSGEFRLGDRAVELSVHEGEHGEEAFLTFN
jgi:type II secretory ATPase GspE/PulE/Tfp pilus assembly ATPase PilB-like protein